MNTIPARLEGVRALMRQRGVTHYLVPSGDEHLNEYVPAWGQRRAWLSGFTGSAGDLLVALAPDETFLFTDGRYHMQAERELAGSGIGLQKVGAKTGKPLAKVLAELAAKHGSALVVGYDPMVMPATAVEAIVRDLQERGARSLAVRPNLVDGVWTGRPAPPRTRLIACPDAWTGKDVGAKARELREALAAQGADALLVLKLDQVAWFLNLRSTDDIPYNPVFESFLFVDKDAIHVFLHGGVARLPAGGDSNGAAVTVHEYGEFLPFLSELGRLAPCRVSVDPTAATQGVLDALQANGRVKAVRASSPVEEAKAIKNAVELRCMEHANLMASVAKTQALLWMQEETEAGRGVTERSFLQEIERRYAAIDGFRQLSFNTIAAAGAHAAIIHYSAADDTPLVRGGFFLIDSGIQMDGGTTDDTRTVIVGDPTDEQRRVYTRVLKAHVAGARHVFPEEASGAMIDAVTRAPMWADHLNYDHGTGHGVGAFLNVHEGPFALSETRRKSFAVHGLKSGMITSIEPGYYREGFGGVRLENLYVVAATGVERDDRAWLEFAPLTWIPFDTRLIDNALLDAGERKWLADYHQECRRRLAPHLSAREIARFDRWIGA